MPVNEINTEKTKALIEASGVSISEWSRLNGFSSGLVYQVLEGKRKCVRGQSFRIALALGLKDGIAMNAAELSVILKQKKPVDAKEG